eukprot:TRINITY_DN66181_c5_g10_i1.p1 TRINITY_DN66181_c5_g10~~TRINITY_DN66181_c5_g10_i1.p1  ORF type:complete len:590 (+),score=271.40 TRINITY_DN66181_c5_g10_i1:116-1885(+)
MIWDAVQTVLSLLAPLALVMAYFQLRARPPPGPVHMPKLTLPFIGSTLALWWNMDRVLPFCLDETRQALKKSGGKVSTFAMSVMGVPACGFVITDPKCVEYVLKTNFNNFIKGPQFYMRLQSLLGRGIFNADGPPWRTQRKTASHMFKLKELRGHMTSVFQKHGRIMCSILARKANKRMEYFDLQDLFFKYTMDSICEIAFGLELHLLECTDPNDRHVRFAAAFDRLQWAAEKRFYSATWWVPRALGLPSHRRFQRDVDYINEYAYNTIRERRAMEAGELNRRGDLLSLFLATKDENGQPFSDEYLRDVLMNFVLAGRDTTAQSLSWTHYKLATDARVERKMHQEVLDVLPTDVREPPTYEHTKYLVYTHAVISEALRLYPSVPKDMKFAVRDDVLPDGTRIPAGGPVTYFPWVTARLESVWGADAADFKPERWLLDDEDDQDEAGERSARRQRPDRLQRSSESRLWSDNENDDALDDGKQQQQQQQQQQHQQHQQQQQPQQMQRTCRSAVRTVSPFKYSVFQAGPRMCLGKHVALLEAKLLTSMLNRQFRFELKPGHVVEPKNSLTLPMKHGLLVSVQEQPMKRSTSD